MGGGSTGGQDMEGVSTGGEGGSASDCNDGGISGGGIGGGMGCEQEGSDGGGGSGGVGQFPGGGDSEKAEQLGKELDKSLGDFDESMGEEQREISSTSRNTEGFDTGSGGNQAGSISLGEQAAGAMGGSGGGGGTAGGDQAGEVGGGPLEGIDAQEVARRTPDDIAVVIDDDIVAKQLREAALAEEDPELRERLWAEYRKYKGM